MILSAILWRSFAIQCCLHSGRCFFRSLAGYADQKASNETVASPSGGKGVLMQSEDWRLECVPLVPPTLGATLAF